MLRRLACGCLWVATKDGKMAVAMVVAWAVLLVFASAVLSAASARMVVSKVVTMMVPMGRSMAGEKVGMMVARKVV
jgi:hypothetical protein